MAYQKVGGTPRFYIDAPSYLNSIGVEYGEGLDKDLFGLNPNNPVLIGNTESMTVKITLPNEIGSLFDTTKGYVGFLNHSISDDIYFSAHSDLYNLDQLFINLEFDTSGVFYIYNKGFSMFTYNRDIGTASDILKFYNMYHLDSNTYEPIPLYMGCITFGSYYDMPVSPDLDLSMEIEFDGVNNIKTTSGHTITQANYQGSPWWYDADGNKVEPWSVGQSTGVSKRNGRRIWSLKFSYMSDKDLFASNYGSSTYMETDTDYDSADLDTDTDNNNIFYYNIDNDNSFSSQVLNKISHGEKFIFQPDNTANNPSDFAICVLDGDSFDMKRVAPNVYDMEMKIREVW